MTQFAGDPNSFPVDFLMPDDSAPPQAVEVNPALEALGDRTANLNARAVQQRTDFDALFLDVIASRALNFGPELTIAASLGKFKGGLYHLMGGTDFYVRRRDLESLTGATTEIGAGAFTTPYTQHDFDVDDDGNIIVVDDLLDSYKEFNVGTGVWTKHQGVLGYDLLKPHVVYEPASGLWIIAGATGALTQMRVFTSSDRVTWTERTAPSTVFDGIWTMGTNGLGRTVLMRHGVSGGIRFSYSDDGGITWSAEQSITLGAGSIGAYTSATAWYWWPRPTWNGYEWLACVNSGSAGGGVSEVYRSTDGATWALASECPTRSIRWLAALGKVWMAMVGNYETAFSVDGGVTWRSSPIDYVCKTIAPCGPPNGANRFVLLGAAANKARIGHAVGVGGLQIAGAP